MEENNFKMTLAGAGYAEIEEKRSVFIGNAVPVSSEEEAREFVCSVKKKYYDARHNVFAYVLEEGMLSRYSDDGEPKGSAGMPVLNVLKMSGADGMCVVVTRYFGGILLGTGGLVRAYSSAAKAAIDNAGFVALKDYAVCSVSCSYSDYQKISSKLETAGAAEEGADFGADVKISVSVPESGVSALEYLVVQLTNGRCKLAVEGHVLRAENIS